MTKRETALLDLCMSDSRGRAAALQNCRNALGRPMVTVPSERGNVASAITNSGFDGIGRVSLACEEIDVAVRQDFTISDVAAGR